MQKKQFIRRLIEIHKSFKWIFGVALLIVVVTSALALLPPYLQREVVDSQRLSLFSKTALFIILTGVTLFTIGITDIIRSLFENRYITFRLDRFSANLMLKKVLEFSISQHLNQNSGITQSIVSKGRHSMSTLVYMVLFTALPTLVEVIVMGVALLCVDYKAGSVMVIGVLIFSIRLAINNTKISPDLKELDDMEHQCAKQESETLRNASLVIASAQEERALKENDTKLGGMQKFAELLWENYTKKWILLEGILAVTWVAASLITAHLVQTYPEKYSIGYMIMIWGWFLRMQNSASRIGWTTRQVMQLYPAVVKYFELLDIESDVKIIPNAVKPEKFEGKIEFRNVTMRYRSRPYIENEEEGIIDTQTPSKDPALDGVSFTINAGERVAIVGESGAGKTSFVHALLRAQDPDEGVILIDGHDLRTLDPKHFRESVGLVEQNVPLLDRSLRYNITFGLNGRSALVTENELNDVAKMACIDRFMEKLTKGFDTIIGERGIRLSGGERQRVGIARALIKKPPILIFDEATSNLDPQNELSIREAIERASVGRTTIIIAHRFSTIRNVDRVIVLDQGKVVGMGSHEELAESCEHYKRLIQPQTISGS